MVDITSSPRLEAGIEPQSHAHRFLTLVASPGGVNGRTLAALFGVKPSEISRQAKRLRGLGLIDGVRSGRFVFWSLTPKGQQALKETNARQIQTSLLFVEYRLSTQTSGAWALVRETQADGATALQKLKIGSYDECLTTWQDLHDQALSLSADESATALGVASDIDRLYA